MAVEMAQPVYVQYRIAFGDNLARVSDLNACRPWYVEDDEPPVLL